MLPPYDASKHEPIDEIDIDEIASELNATEGGPKPESETPG